MTVPVGLPGLRFTAVRPSPEPSPLRSDVAAFIGATRRGPADPIQAIRVEGWREYIRIFGGLAPDAHTTYAVRGYFANGGEVAWIVRLCGQRPAPVVAHTEWAVGEVDVIGGTWSPDARGRQYHAPLKYRIDASSPGDWANGTTVRIRYWERGPTGAPTLDFAVQAPNEPPEYVIGVSPEALEDPTINIGSAYIHLTRTDGPAGVMTIARGPRWFEWQIPTPLSGGTASNPRYAEYRAAAACITDTPEVALIAVPDLRSHLDDRNVEDITLQLLDDAARLNDRVVVLDLPESPPRGQRVVDATTILRVAAGDDIKFGPNATGDRAVRAGAAYHPWLRVDDPLATVEPRQRTVPPSGHVAGVISRLDRERGAQHTPANAELLDAFDLTPRFDDDEEVALFEAGVNLLRCAPGRGLVVWGGRTLDPSRNGRFLAHRRLIHRLVRAIRRVAEPLVFETNGPEQWLVLVRAITTVLLETWERGGLKGSRADEAFRIQCDHFTNPREERDAGRMTCLIEVAPAAPMEFIELRVVLSAEGRLEVFET
jgi:uncharacterized protein